MNSQEPGCRGRADSEDLMHRRTGVTIMTLAAFLAASPVLADGPQEAEPGLQDVLQRLQTLEQDNSA